VFAARLKVPGREEVALGAIGRQRQAAVGVRGQAIERRARRCPLVEQRIVGGQAATVVGQARRRIPRDRRRERVVSALVGVAIAALVEGEPDVRELPRWQVARAVAGERRVDRGDQARVG
jgi:hypothetical protein